MDDLISRKSLYDKMCEAEELARQRVIDTRTSFPDGSLNPVYIRYMTQLSERTRFKEMIFDEASAQPDWNEMVVICDCCGHAIQVKRQ